jgi:hypothetical protein
MGQYYRQMRHNFYNIYTQGKQPDHNKQVHHRKNI